MEKEPKTRRTFEDPASSTTKPFFGDGSGNGDFFSKGNNPTYAAPDKAMGETQATEEKPDAAPPISKEKEAAFRKALFDLFELFEGKVVGDKLFDEIITQEKWQEHKDAEKVIKDKNKKAMDDYDIAMAVYNLGEPTSQGAKPKKPVPEPVNPYTTCIDVQRHLLEDALKAAGLEVRKVSDYDDKGFLKKGAPKVKTYAFGSLGPKEAKELGAWNEASRGMKERPKPGDLIILAFRGKEVDKAAKEVSDLNTIMERSETADAVQQEFQAKADEAKAALQGLTDIDKIKEAKSKVIAANNLFANAQAKAVKAAKEAKAAKGVLPMSTKKLETARTQANHERFEFSHVGYFVSKSDNQDGTETWKTFDGGQTLEVGKERKQGSKMGERIYRPELNEISGEHSQGGEARWLQGWISIEKLAKEKP